MISNNRWIAVIANDWPATVRPWINGGGRAGLGRAMITHNRWLAMVADDRWLAVVTHNRRLAVITHNRRIAVIANDWPLTRRRRFDGGRR